MMPSSASPSSRIPNRCKKAIITLKYRKMALLFASVIFFVYLCSRKAANANAAELSSVKK